MSKQINTWGQVNKEIKLEMLSLILVARPTPEGPTTTWHSFLKKSLGQPSLPCKANQNEWELQVDALVHFPSSLPLQWGFTQQKYFAEHSLFLSHLRSGNRSNQLSEKHLALHKLQLLSLPDSVSLLSYGMRLCLSLSLNYYWILHLYVSG